MPVRFGNPHPTHRLRPIVAAGACFRQALQVLGLSSREIVNRDAIDSGGALVPGHLDKRPVQILLGADLVNQAEPFSSFHSRFQGRPLAPTELPAIHATMDALTPVQPALRILIRDNEHRYRSLHRSPCFMCLAF